MSLLDMMEHYASVWFRIAQILAHLRIPELLPEFDDESREKDKDLLIALKSPCNDIGLSLTCVAIQRAIDGLENKMDRKEFSNHIKDIDRRLADEMKSTLFLFVSRERSPYYTTQELFGREVAETFPSAIVDIDEAGKCLALGRGTACVFHLMRVMEILLRHLGKLLGIPYAPSWESYLSQITTRIQTKHKAKGIAWRRDEPYFKDILGDLQAVKIAWRNPTIHVQSVHTLEEAENILRAVRSFARRLAQRSLPRGQSRGP